MHLMSRIRKDYLLDKIACRSIFLLETKTPAIFIALSLKFYLSLKFFIFFQNTYCIYFDDMV